MTATFYDVLDVPTDANADEIQAAYREQAKRYHPDVSDHPDAEARFRAVVRAEEVLGDPDERARYDRLGHEAYLRVVDGPAVDIDDVVDETRSDDREVRTDDADAVAGDEDGASAGEASAGGDRSGRSDGTPDRGRSRGHGRSTRSTGSPPGDRSARRTDRSASSAGASTDRDPRTGDTAAGDRSGGAPTDRDDDWWREAWEPGTGEENWRQAVDPDRRSYTPSDDDAPPGRAADVAAAAERHRKEWQAAGRGGDESFWSAEVEQPVDTDSRRGPSALDFRSRDTAVTSMILLVVYPVFVYFAVASPAFAITVAAAMATVGVAVTSLLRPAASLIVFGTWSLLSPLLLFFLGHSALSLTGLAVLGSFWIPLALTGLLVVAAPR